MQSSWENLIRLSASAFIFMCIALLVGCANNLLCHCVFLFRWIFLLLLSVCSTVLAAEEEYRAQGMTLYSWPVLLCSRLHLCVRQGLRSTFVKFTEHLLEQYSSTGLKDEKHQRCETWILGGMVVQWLELLPQSKKVVGFQTWGLFGWT